MESVPLCTTLTGCLWVQGVECGVCRNECTALQKLTLASQTSYLSFVHTHIQVVLLLSLYNLVLVSNVLLPMGICTEPRGTKIRNAKHSPPATVDI